MVERMNEADINDALSDLPEWGLVDGREAIFSEFQFSNFIEAFSFMTACAIWAEKLNHHPEWFNVYKSVRVTLATHDVNGLSELDIKLARKMDALAGR